LSLMILVFTFSLMIFSILTLYDVDFKEVIDIRRYFYEETDNYHLIASSVIEPEWIEKIPKDEKHSTSIMVAGLFMYLKEDEIKTLIRRLKVQHQS